MEQEGYVIQKGLAVQVNFFPPYKYETFKITTFCCDLKWELGFVTLKILLNQENIFCPAVSKLLQQTSKHNIINRPKVILQPTGSPRKDLMVQKRSTLICRKIKNLHDFRSDER